MNASPDCESAWPSLERSTLLGSSLKIIEKRVKESYKEKKNQYREINHSPIRLQWSQNFELCQTTFFHVNDLFALDDHETLFVYGC